MANYIWQSTVVNTMYKQHKVCFFCLVVDVTDDAPSSLPAPFRVERSLLCPSKRGNPTPDESSVGRYCQEQQECGGDGRQRGEISLSVAAVGNEEQTTASRPCLLFKEK